MTIREFGYNRHLTQSGDTGDSRELLEYIKKQPGMKEMCEREDLAVWKTAKFLLIFVLLVMPASLIVALYLDKAGGHSSGDQMISFWYPLMLAIATLVWFFRSWLRSKRRREAGYSAEFERYLAISEDLRSRLINACHLACDWDDEVGDLSARLHVSYTNIASSIILCEITDNAEAAKYFRLKLREFSDADFLGLGVEHGHYFDRARSQLIEKLELALHRLNQGLPARQEKNN